MQVVDGAHVDFAIELPMQHETFCSQEKVNAI